MKKYDVFISYAVEDKFPIAAGIAERLKKSGLKVYFVGDKLSSGDLISDTVNHGLEQSNFCVLIVSHNYRRKWPAIERNYILHRQKKEGKKLIFPVWNNISYDDVARYFPELIDHYAPSIDTGLDAVADHLQHAIYKCKNEEVKDSSNERNGEATQDLSYKEKNEEVKGSMSPAGKFLLALAGILLALFALYMFIDDEPRDPPIRNTHPLSPDR